jgi:hypothetical protein
VINPRDAIAQTLMMQQQLAQRQAQQNPVPKPFMPPVQPVRTLPPTMLGTPPVVQRAAIEDVLGRTQRMIDPADRLDPDGATAIGKALKKYLTPTVEGGGAAP